MHSARTDPAGGRAAVMRGWFQRPNVRLVIALASTAAVALLVSGVLAATAACSGSTGLTVAQSTAAAPSGSDGTSGSADPGSTTAVIQDFNDLVAADDRVDSVILPISDGLTLICKR